MFAGVHTALVTPFKNGAFDRKAFADLIEAQIEGGVAGIVPVGTTGESPTLTHDEHNDVVKAAIEIAARRCPVIAGTGSNSTAEAVALTEEAARMGADAALLVAPYYNKPSQEGVYRHFRAVADAVDIPLILYSIPGRCGIEIAVETVARLAADSPNIRAIKESGGSVERVSALRQALPDQFEILSGDDSLTLPFLSVGAVGVISVASNLVPARLVDLVSRSLDGDAAGARQIHEALYPLFKELFVEPNPVPTKAALAMLGRMSADVRLPLCPASDANLVRLRAVLERCGVVSAES